MTAEEIKALKGRGWLLNRGTETFSARVVTGNGRMTAEQIEAVAAAARRHGSGVVTLTSRLSMEVPGVPAAEVGAFEAAMEEAGLSVGGTGPRVRPVVSCKGTICPHGLIDTFALSEKIHQRFYVGWRGVDRFTSPRTATESTTRSGSRTPLSPSGVPAIGCSTFTGIESGAISLSAKANSTSCSSVSPMPMIPPQQI